MLCFEVSALLTFLLQLSRHPLQVYSLVVVKATFFAAILIFFIGTLGLDDRDFEVLSLDGLKGTVWKVDRKELCDMVVQAATTYEYLA